jgi:cellulose synthase/poly-beta-1,6-N-acetylglucosamine synthase-like glycosyltransferase
MFSWTLVAQIIILVIYSLCLLFIFVFSLSQFHLIRLYLKSKKTTYSPVEPLKEIPHVTIQLPVYNELYVIERLIDSVCSINYPSDKLQIQVLDDSTDDSVTLTETKINDWKSRGINIEHVKREERTGYKAGALKYGLEKATGEFIAIFDADFIPDPTFLHKTLPHFTNSNIGLVQTKWGHINRDYSVLTELQAFGLDAHFSIEQVGRNSIGSFINFNGTGGIWRKKTIIESGNWQSDTLTEDLDLSYRAQLKGWKFKYLEDVISPAELPPIMSAVKSQQYRWTKGGAETARKHLGAVLRSKHPIKTKIHGVMHLLNSAIFVAILFSAVLSIPLLFIKEELPQLRLLFEVASIFLLSFVVIAVQYYISSSVQKESTQFKKITSFIIRFPLFLSFSMGLSLHNAIAVLQGYSNKKTPFIRTPKFNIDTKNNKKISNKYITKNLTAITLMEGILSIYFAFGIYSGIRLKDYGLLPFHIMLFTGFISVFSISLFHSLSIFRKIAA